MGLFKKRRYYFTDSSFASDTIIAYILGGIALIIDIAGIVASISTKGHVPIIFGTLYICAIVLSVVGGFFAYLGNKAQEGGVKGKRISIILNLVALFIPLMVIFL